MAKLVTFFSISLEKTSIPIPINSKIRGEVVLKKDVTLFIIFYLKNESTNSNLLKTCKSSIPSPTPMYFTGI